MRLMITAFTVAALFLTGCTIDYHLRQVTTAAGDKHESFTGMEVSFLGIENGEATLIRFPNSYTILVDTGGKKEGSLTEHEKAAGKEKQENSDRYSLLQILKRMDVQEIDLLVLSNHLEGNAGQLAEIVKNIPVSEIMVSKLLHGQGLDIRQLSGIAVREVVEGDVIPLPLGADIRILYPSEPLSLSPQANSLVFVLQHNKIRFLFTGEINDQVELRLIQKFDLHAQILKVSDGGSIHASHPDFLKEVDAQVAVIFSGNGEEVGRSKVMDRLIEAWMDVYQTKVHGTISVRSTGEDYEIVDEF